MSKVYFDHLLVLEPIEEIVRKHANSPEEKEELWHLIDEIVHHRAMDFVLSNLDKEHHHEFLEIFHSCPHDETVIFSYLREKTHIDIEESMRKELESVSGEISKLLE